MQQCAASCKRTVAVACVRIDSATKDIELQGETTLFGTASGGNHRPATGISVAWSASGRGGRARCTLANYSMTSFRRRFSCACCDQREQQLYRRIPGCICLLPKKGMEFEFVQLAAFCSYSTLRDLQMVYKLSTHLLRRFRRNEEIPRPFAEIQYFPKILHSNVFLRLVYPTCKLCFNVIL